MALIGQVFEALWQGAVWPVVALVVGVLARIVWARFIAPQLRRRVIWRFRSEKAEERQPKIVVEDVPRTDTGMYSRPTVGLGAVTSTGMAATALAGNISGFGRNKEAFRRSRLMVLVSSDQMAWKINNDIVVIGGPKHNRITEKLMDLYSNNDPALAAIEGIAPYMSASSLSLTTEGNTIMWFGKGYCGSVGGSAEAGSGTFGYNGVDYGVVLRIPGRSEGSRAVVFFGSQTFGVQAATQWLIEAGSGQRDAATKRFLRKHTNVAVLVRTEVTNGMLHEPELIQIVALPDELPRASLVPDEGSVGVEDATGSTNP